MDSALVFVSCRFLATASGELIYTMHSDIRGFPDVWRFPLESIVCSWVFSLDIHVLVVILIVGLVNLPCLCHLGLIACCGYWADAHVSNIRSERCLY